MQQRTTRVNASEETIKMGRLGIRFLLTGEDSNGSVSVSGPGRWRRPCNLRDLPRHAAFPSNRAVGVLPEGGEALGRVGGWIQDQTA